MTCDKHITINAPSCYVRSCALLGQCVQPWRVPPAVLCLHCTCPPRYNLVPAGPPCVCLPAIPGPSAKVCSHGFSRNTRHKLLYLFWREGIAGRQVSCAAVLLQKGTGARCRCHSSSPSCSSAGHGAEEVAGVQRPARVNTGIRPCRFLPSPQGRGCRSLASSSKREQTSNLGLLFSPFTRLQSKTSMMLHSVVKDLQ